MPRSQFDQELNKMHVDLDRMCHLVVLAIENCVTAFKEQDYELARDSEERRHPQSAEQRAFPPRTASGGRRADARRLHCRR